MANKSSNPGNFANNPARASEAGRKGGQNSHGTRRPEAANDAAAT
jgi:general stress protein YciG